MFYYLVFILGASLGSFFGLIIDRFPEHSIISPASHCNHCQTLLKPCDLIPILSQLTQKFRCRYCGIQLPLTYTLLELTCGLLLLAPCFDILSIAHVLTFYAGLILAIYDARSQSFPLMVWCIFFMLTLPFGTFQGLTVLFLALAMLAQLRNIKMGAGDFLYLAMTSLTLDFTGMLWLIQISSGIGILFLLKNKRERTAFVPFLLIAYTLIIFISCF